MSQENMEAVRGAFALIATPEILKPWLPPAIRSSRCSSWRWAEDRPTTP
jgi:hypothetical protein